MAKSVQVVSISTSKKEIKGKPCDVVILNLLNLEKGTVKKEEVLSFNKLYSAAAVLNAGDICDASWEKKTVGDKDYYNLIQLTKTGTGDVSAPVVKPSYGGGSATPSGGGKSPDTQTSIARQNVNNVAMQFVTKMLEQGIYPKKSTPDMLFEEIKRFSKKFEAYVTLKDDYGQLTAVTGAPLSDPAGDDEEGMLG